MNSLFEVLPYLSNYHSAFVVLASMSLMILVQNFMTAPLAFVKEEQVPGMPLKFDHSKLSFRASRTFSNSAENFPAFGWALLVAIIAGASPTIVNWTAIVFIGFRLAFWVVYYTGIGKPAGGPRTMMFVGGLLSNIVLAAAALWALME